MRVLFVGLGSIGARHLRNLCALCAARGVRPHISALRSSGRALPADIAGLLNREWRRLPAGECFDMAFITNPTHLHAQALSELKGRAGAFFIEKPIFERAGYGLEETGLGAEAKAYVAAPMRHTALYAEVKKRLAQRRVFSARAICSSYLPDWRKGADYRGVYSARADMGGGVTLDLIHEWDYLTDLFGMPLQSFGIRGQYSHLEIDSDDLSVYIARYPRLLCEVHLDYFGREYRRTLELLCEDGTITADFGAGTLKLPAGGGQCETLCLAEDANARYEREMAWFMDYARGAAAEADNPNPPRRALDVLRLALGEAGQ